MPSSPPCRRPAGPTPIGSGSLGAEIEVVGVLVHVECQDRPPAGERSGVVRRPLIDQPACAATRCHPDPLPRALPIAVSSEPPKSPAMASASSSISWRRCSRTRSSIDPAWPASAKRSAAAQCWRCAMWPEPAPSGSSPQFSAYGREGRSASSPASDRFGRIERTRIGADPVGIALAAEPLNPHIRL